jgi:hypothetical protein
MLALRLVSWVKSSESRTCWGCGVVEEVDVAAEAVWGAEGTTDRVTKDEAVRSRTVRITKPWFDRASGPILSSRRAWYGLLTASLGQVAQARVRTRHFSRNSASPFRIFDRTRLFQTLESDMLGFTRSYGSSAGVPRDRVA